MTYEDYFRRMRHRERDEPEMPIRSTVCHDYPVVGGMYAEFSHELSRLDADLRDSISRKWFCHNTPGFACKGNADVCGVENRESRSNTQGP